MPPPLLLLQDISLTFGVTPLLSSAELAVAAGDRICWSGATAPVSPPSCALRPGWCSPMPDIASPSLAPQSVICRKNRIYPASRTP
jgi:ATP-binding cassette subfamily F protein uup